MKKLFALRVGSGYDGKRLFFSEFPHVLPIYLYLLHYSPPMRLLPIGFDVKEGCYVTRLLRVVTRLYIKFQPL